MGVGVWRHVPTAKVLSKCDEAGGKALSWVSLLDNGGGVEPKETCWFEVKAMILTDGWL